MSRIEQLRKIVADRTQDTVDGVLVDLYTASAIVACHDAGNERTKALIETAPLDKVAKVAFRFS